MIGNSVELHPKGSVPIPSTMRRCEHYYNVGVISVCLLLIVFGIGMVILGPPEDRLFFAIGTVFNLLIGARPIERLIESGSEADYDVV